MIRIRKLALRTQILVLLLLAFGSWAQPLKPYVDLTGAYQTNHIKHTNQLLDQSPWPPDRYQTNSINDAAVFELGAGAFFIIPDPRFPFLTLGLSLQRTQKQNISGSIEPFSCPELTQTDFKYKTQQNRVLLQTQLYFLPKYPVAPFVILGLGLARTSVNPVQMESTFQSETQYDFAAQTGLGLAYLITPQSALSLGVRWESPVKLRIGPLSQSIRSYSAFAQLRTVFF
jgi:Outer membrane protein beta-barrel domain